MKSKACSTHSSIALWQSKQIFFFLRDCCEHFENRLQPKNKTKKTKQNKTKQNKTNKQTSFHSTKQLQTPVSFSFYFFDMSSDVPAFKVRYFASDFEF